MTARAEREATVCNQRGLHARAAARFAAAAAPFAAKVTVAKGPPGRSGEAVDAASLMDLLMLGAGKGTPLTITAEGDDAEEAAWVLAALVDGGFGEAE